MADVTRVTSAPPGSSARRRSLLGYALLAVLAYVPPLISQRGTVGADTKNYLYLDPARLLERAFYLWDEHTGAGTVTHQNIGYLFPMGPWFRFFDLIGVPDWIAQRLWLGTILFAAGAGVLYLCRSIRLTGPGAAAAAVVFMLSPYSLHYAARISVILLPWAALGWLLGFVVRSMRQGGWTHVALFAVVASAAGSVNATALAFVCIAPGLWMVWTWLVLHEATWKRTLGVAAKLGVLTILTSVWWLIPLTIERKYGINLLKTTETIETVARTSTAPEVLRGLGHWFFYGRDKLGPWIEASVDYTQTLWVIAAGYALATFGLLAAGLTRWRLRGYFVALLLIGTTIAVGAYPFDDSSWFGAALQKAAEGSSIGLALRSTGRAVPLVALAMAMFVGAGVSVASDAWARRPERVRSRTAGIDTRRVSITTAAIVIALAILAFPVLWNGNVHGANLQRPEDVPDYWQEAIAYVDAKPYDTRVLELPGSDFASYRWGNAVDPITPGLMDRPWLSRELIPLGSHATADVINSLDRRLQEGVWEPDAIAPVARYLAAGDILVRLDLESDRYNLVRSYEMVQAFTPTPAGLSGPTEFGSEIPGDLRYSQIDERYFLASDTETGAPILVYSVDDPQTIVRTMRASKPVVMSGDGEGVVDISAAGLVDGTEPLLYSGAFTTPDALDAQITDDAVLVVTDTNRQRARRWNTMRDNPGFTEREGSEPLDTDPTDARLPLFPDASDGAYTYVEQRGVSSIDATGYGNTITYTPEDRPANAIDGDVNTAWRVGGFDDVVGDRIRVALDGPVTTDHINLVQPITGPRNRFITRATLTFDGGDPIAVDLDDASRTPEGQTISFPSRTFATLEIRVDESNAGRQTSYTGWSPVGFAEIRIDGVQVDEFVRMPSDLFDATGAAADEHDTYLVMTRLRSLSVPTDNDEEIALARVVSLPTARTFSLGGEVRLSPTAADATIDRALGIASAAEGGVTANSSERLPGSVNARASNAIDDDPTTAWTTPFVGVQGQAIELQTAQPVTFDRMDLEVVVDDRHSLPTTLRIQVDDEVRVVDFDLSASGETGVVTVPVEFEPVTGSTISVTLEAVQPRTTVDYLSESTIQLPVSIAELGIPGVVRAAQPPAIPPECRSDLVMVNGRPAPVRIVGTPTAAVSRDALTLESCGPAELSAGDNDVESIPGADTGFDVDRLVFSSAVGGGAGEQPVPGRQPSGADAGSDVTVEDDGAVSTRVTIEPSDEAQWLVLGQSFNEGWNATIKGGDDLGAPTLINGYANGWKLDARDDSIVVDIVWTPQRSVSAAVLLSLLVALGCVVLAIVDWWRRRGRVEATAPTRIGFAMPWSTRHAGGRPRAIAIVGSVLLAGVLGAALARPWVGLVVAALTGVACVAPRVRAVLTLGSPVALALAAAYIIVQQFRYEYPPAFEWPTFFGSVHVLGWLAVLLLVADVVVGLARGTEVDEPSATASETGADRSDSVAT